MNESTRRNVRMIVSGTLSDGVLIAGTVGSSAPSLAPQGKAVRNPVAADQASVAAQ